MKNNFISSVWNFKDISQKETNYLTHDYLRWYGKLIPQLVEKLIKLYSNENDTILANFAGSGTVLLESNILKRNSVGIDSSPLSVLLCKVKTTPYYPKIEEFIDLIKKKSLEKTDYITDEVDLKWYDLKSFNDLQVIKNLINKIKDEKDKNFYYLALASITRKVSKIDSRCINHIVVDNNKSICNVFYEYEKKLAEMKNSMVDLMSKITDHEISIIKGDARKLETIKDNSIDLLISHPPYLGCINYSNIFKLANKIIGYDYDYIKEEDISTSSLEKYMFSMKKVFDEMHRVIKKNKYVCVIIGDNRVNGEIIPTFSYFIQYAKEIGFTLKDIFVWILNQKAGMSIKRRGNHIDHNYILIFEKN